MALTLRLNFQVTVLFIYFLWFGSLGPHTDENGLVLACLTSAYYDNPPVRPVSVAARIASFILECVPTSSSLTEVGDFFRARKK